MPNKPCPIGTYSGRQLYFRRIVDSSRLSPEKLCEEVVAKVYSGLKPGEEAEILLSELLSRYEILTGIKRDTKGRILVAGKVVPGYSDPDLR